MTRFRLTSLMILVAAIAAVLGAMRIGAEWVFQVAFFLLILALLTGLLGAIVPRGNPAWLGFAIFLWGYSGVLCYLADVSDSDVLLPNAAIDLIAHTMHPSDLPAPPPPRVPDAFLDQVASHAIRNKNASRPLIVGHDWLASNDWVDAFPSDSLEGYDTSMLSPSELAAVKAYSRSAREYRAFSREASEKNSNAQVIGMIGSAIVAGFLGSRLGPFLSRHIPRPASPDCVPRPDHADRN